MVSKGHLGHADKTYWPQNRGFDHFYGNLVVEVDDFTKLRCGVVDWQHIDVTTTLASAQPLPPALVALYVAGQELARTTVKSAPFRLPSPPANHLMWVWTLIQRCRSTTSIAGRSVAMEQVTR